MADNKVDGVFFDVGGKRPNVDNLFDGPAVEHFEVAAIADHFLSSLSTDVDIEPHL